MTTVVPGEYTLNFEYGSVKESHSSVKKQMKDGSYKTYTYKHKENTITLQRSRFMQNFVAYNYEKLKLMKNTEITEIVSKHYQSVYDNDKEYSYSPQTISKCMKYDAKNYTNEIKERKITQARPIKKEIVKTDSPIEVLFPHNKPEAQRKFKAVLVASLNTKDFDMRRVRNTDHEINDNDDRDLFCSSVVKGTEFDFRPMITYILRAERFLSTTSSKNIASELIMDGRLWLEWFIPYNLELLIKIVEQYAKDYSIKTKKSLPTDSAELIHDNIGIIVRICKFLSPYEIEDPLNIDKHVLKVLMSCIGRVLNPYVLNDVKDLSNVDYYDEIDSYRKGTFTMIKTKHIDATNL